MTDSQTMNKWEKQGLGKAPFRLVGMFSLPSRALLEANPTAYNNEMALMPRGFHIGSCGVCSISLINNFLIKSACGQKFSVGCDCVKKTGDTVIIDQVKEKKKAIAKAKRDAKRKAEFEKREAKIQQELADQREKNGGLTNDELEKQNRIDLQNRKQYKMQCILSPVIAALEEKNGGFAEDMIDSINRAKMPTSGALAICAKIYGAYYAKKETGKTRGKYFNPAYAEGIIIAKQLFVDAKQELEELNAAQ